jgi:hypothetical protein
MMDIVQSCLGDVIIITTIAGYAYVGILLIGIVLKRHRRGVS